jgi:hypothetical protein
MKEKKDYNTKEKDPYFHKINALIDGGKYTHSMDKQINNAHASLNKDKIKK